LKSTLGKPQTDTQRTQEKEIKIKEIDTSRMEDHPLDSMTTITRLDSSARDNLRNSMVSSKVEDSGRMRFINRNSNSRNNSLVQNTTSSRRESHTPTGNYTKPV
jgi:hypothetical protein